MIKFILSLLLTVNAFAAEDLIALNITLNPEPRLDRVAREINNDLENKNHAGFRFDPTHFPHLTVLQLFVKVPDLSKVKAIVKEEAKTFYALKVKGLSGAEDLVNLDFDGSEDLQKFQETILKRVAAFAQKNGNKKAFFNGEDVEQKWVDYVQSFMTKKTGVNFKPHMTLGLGKKEFAEKYSKTSPLIETYSFNEVIFYQLGNYGAARKELERITLGPGH
jgi:2'-5' RNA ligase